MNGIMVLALQELRNDLRNRWVLAATTLLAILALALAFLGNAPIGTTGAGRIEVLVVSLSSLSIFLVPLIALLLSHDAVVGEVERGTMLLLLSYPVSRAEIIGGKFLAHLAIVAIAVTVGFGSAAAVLAATGDVPDAAAWGAFLRLCVTSIALGASFLGLGYFASAIVSERATAAGLALGAWLLLVIVFDLVLLGGLAAFGSDIPRATVEGILMLNPADVFRLVNLAGGDTVSEAAGMAGIGADLSLPPVVLHAGLVVWAALPLTAAWLVFRRREV